MRRPPRRVSPFVAAILCLWAAVSRAQPSPPTAPAEDEAPAAPRVELLIFGPGDDVFGRYGHAAIRVLGPGAADRVFNFGITDWTKPNYIRDFLTGRVRFWGDEKTWARTRPLYVKWDREIVRYPLHLTPAETARLIGRMEHDVLPEHREYLYDTFRDNCATRLRDLIDDATGGAVRASLADDPLGPSYREDVRVAFAAFPGLLLLTEIIPGLPLDAPRTTWERMYRPAVLGEAIARVRVSRGGTTVALAGRPIIERTRTGPPPLTGWPDLGQALLGGAAFALALLGVAVRRRGPRARAAAASLLWAPGVLMSLVLTVVAVGTVWPDMQQNWLLVALPPTDLLLAAPLWRALRRRPRPPGPFLRGYLVVRAVSTLALAALAPVVPLFAGPVPPRLLCLVGVALLALALDARPASGAERPA